MAGTPLAMELAVAPLTLVSTLENAIRTIMAPKLAEQVDVQT